jgi:hypothetical protein
LTSDFQSKSRLEEGDKNSAMRCCGGLFETLHGRTYTNTRPTAYHYTIQDICCHKQSHWERAVTVVEGVRADMVEELI